MAAFAQGERAVLRIGNCGERVTEWRTDSVQSNPAIPVLPESSRLNVNILDLRCLQYNFVLPWNRIEVSRAIFVSAALSDFYQLAVPTSSLGLTLSFSSSRFRSERTASMSGTRLYRKTLYPALVNIASRFASCFSLALWLASSSSTMTTTLNDFRHITKSATFLSNVFRVACSRVSSNAEKATWHRTMYSGSASVSRKYIGCSFLVNIALCLIGLCPLVFPLLDIMASVKATIEINTSNMASFVLMAALSFNCCAMNLAHTQNDAPRMNRRTKQLFEYMSRLYGVRL
jgi:hypothetical protein